jgi:protein-S-isoprenylcysteine O-methyltransferase Ste14
MQRMTQVLNTGAALIWAILTGLRLRQGWEMHALLPILLASQSGLAAFWLVRRKRAITDSSIPVQLTAWGSAFLPMILQISDEYLMGVVINISGLCLVLGSLMSLGSSFGIAPADRGLVQQGAYRFLRHPMYAGELLSILGALIGNWTWWNGIVLSGLLLSLVWRIQNEERILAGYQNYQECTNWRMLPGIW